MRLLGLPPVLVVLSADGPAIRWQGRGAATPLASRAPRARAASRTDVEAPISRTVLKGNVTPLREDDFDFEGLCVSAAHFSVG